MPDYIPALNQRRADLCRQRQAIEKRAEREIAEIDKEIKEINLAIETVNRAVRPYLCKRCKGLGTVRLPDAAGQMDDVTCSLCHGTGVNLEAAAK